MELNPFSIICFLILCSTIIFVVSIICDYKSTKRNYLIDTQYLEKRMIRIHRNYIVGFLTLGVISLLTALYGGDSKSNIFTYISFASTITSFVLSILAIFVTMQSNSGLENQISKMELHSKLMKKLSKKLDNTLTQVTAANEKVAKSTRELSEVTNNIIPQVQETLSHHEDILNQKLSGYNSIPQNKNENIKIDSLREWYISNISATGLAATYVCCLSLEKNKSFNRNELFQLMSDYAFGVIVGISSAGFITTKSDDGFNILCQFSIFSTEQIYTKIKEYIKQNKYGTSYLSQINQIRNYFGIGDIEITVSDSSK